MNKELHAAEEEYQARLRQLPTKFKSDTDLDRLLYKCCLAAGRAGKAFEEAKRAIDGVLKIENKEQISDHLREHMYSGWARGIAKRNGKSAEAHLAQRHALKSYQEYLSSLKEGWHDNRERSQKIYKCAEYAGGTGITLHEVREVIMQVVVKQEVTDCKTYDRLVKIINSNYMQGKIQLNPNLTEFEKYKQLFENASRQKQGGKLGNLIHQVIRDGSSIENTTKTIFAVAEPYGYNHSEITNRVKQTYDAYSKQQLRAASKSEETLIADNVKESYLLETEIKRDGNEPQIVARLRHRGAEVYCVTPAERNSAGYPDLWVVYGGREIHAEIKTGQGRLNEAQWRFQLHTQVARIRNAKHCDMLLNWLKSGDEELPQSLQACADEVDWR